MEQDQNEIGNENHENDLGMSLKGVNVTKSMRPRFDAIIATYRVPSFVLKLSLILLLAYVSPAEAETSVTELEDAKPHCRDILSSERFQEIMKIGSGALSTDRDGAVLLGSVCSLEDLDAYFTAAGWEYMGTNEGYFTNQFYERDVKYAFCDPRIWILTTFMYRCRAVASVSLYKNKITQINSTLSK